MKKIPHNVLSNPRRSKIFPGALIKKDASEAVKEREARLEKTLEDMSTATGLVKEFDEKYKEQASAIKAMAEAAEARGEKDGEIESKLKEFGAGVADMMAKWQASEEQVASLQKQLDNPYFAEGSDKKAADRDLAVQVQKRYHVDVRGGSEDDFKLDEDNLVNIDDYRGAVSKLVRHGGLESLRNVKGLMTDGEQKAFESSGMDSMFFPVELLGFETDCEIECASLLDLYHQVTVSRSKHMYPHIDSYGDMGTYDCDAKCDAEFGPEGNIKWLNSMTFDFRGAFCFNRLTLKEANYDLLGFMIRSIQRSHRINRNRVLITGDGVQEPLGWLTANKFPVVDAPTQNPTHQDLRQFLASHPAEYNMALPVMHQNTFAYFASMVDANGRFLFGDGLMSFSPSDVRESLRISNCLPDPTEGGTKGSAANPFDAGAFIMAAGDWKSAYANVSHNPLTMEQNWGGSSKWCIQYQFGARDGGFVMCSPSARIFRAGAAA